MRRPRRVIVEATLSREALGLTLIVAVRFATGEGAFLGFDRLLGGSCSIAVGDGDRLLLRSRPSSWVRPPPEVSVALAVASVRSCQHRLWNSEPRCKQDRGREPSYRALQQV